jgi:CelD/BcsL family acetyltransferase involved in cellulose biosynthesis
MGHQLLNDLKVRGWGVHASTHPQCVVELPQNWEAYLKGLSSKERGKIGLRARRLEKKYRVRIRKCQERAELDSALETLFELHGSHWQLRGLPGSFQVPERLRGYRELAPLLLSRQRLEFWLLELDEKIVAAQFALRHGETVYSLQEDFDPEYSSDSVGYVLRGYVLRNLIDRGGSAGTIFSAAWESRRLAGAPR